MRRNSWQDGVLGTNCPIPPKWNWTYQFQVKDQIGSFFYFPSLNLQRASGGFGSFILNNRVIIPIPFAQPDGDIVIFIGDWYTQNHTVSISSLFSVFLSSLLFLFFFPVLKDFFNVNGGWIAELNCIAYCLCVFRPWRKPWMLEKTLASRMEFSLMGKGHSVTIILLYLMESNMKPSMLTQVQIQKSEFWRHFCMKFIFPFH